MAKLREDSLTTDAMGISPAAAAAGRVESQDGQRSRRMMPTTDGGPCEIRQLPPPASFPYIANWPPHSPRPPLGPAAQCPRRGPLRAALLSMLGSLKLRRLARPIA